MNIEITVQKNKKATTYQRSIPGGWNDIDSLEKRLLYFKKCVTLEKEIAQIEILKDILELPKSLFLSLSATDLVQIAEQIAFMFEKVSSLPITDRFDWASRTWYMPKKSFDNGTAFEFAFADEFYTEFAQNPDDVEAVIICCAALLRAEPKKPNLNREEILENAELLLDLPIEFLAIVIHYFEALKININQSGKDAELFKENIPQEGEININVGNQINFGWWTTYRSIAKLGVFGNFAAVCASNFWDVFKFCIEEKQRTDEQERIMKSYTNN